MKLIFLIGLGSRAGRPGTEIDEKTRNENTRGSFIQDPRWQDEGSNVILFPACTMFDYQSEWKREAK